MAGAKGVRAGRAWVELFADDNALYRSLDKAAARLKAFGATVMGQGAKLGGAGGVVMAPLTKFFSDAVSKGSDIKNISVRFGETTKSVSELAGAFSIAGSDLGEFSGTLDGLSAKIKSAADSNGELVEGLRGLRGRDLITLPIEKQLDRIADRFKDITLASDQANVAQELFGASGNKLLPFLREGSAGLAKLKSEAVKAGEIMSGDDIERSATVWKSLNRIWLEVKNTLVSVGAALLPTTEQTATLRDQMQGAFMIAREWVGANKDLIITVAKVAAGMVAAGAALVGIGAGISAVAPIITTAVAGTKLLVAAFLSLASPVGIFSLAVGGLGALFLTQTEAGQKMTDSLGAGFNEFANTAKSAWGGIVSAIKKGDLQGAFEIVGTALELEWEKVCLYWTEVWQQFRDGWLADFRRGCDIIQNSGIVTVAKGTWDNFKGYVEAGTESLVDAFGAIYDAAGIARGDARHPERAAAAAIEAVAPSVPAVKAEDPAIVAAKARIADADARLKKLIAKAEDVAGPGGGDGKPVKFGVGFGGAGKILADQDIMRQKELMEQAKQGSYEARSSVTDRQKGIFSGPAAQQLGIGDTVGKRQLDMQKGIRDGVDKVANNVADLGKQVVVFKR